MLNVQIIRPEQLPAEPGIVFHIDNQNRIVALTASRCVAERCEPAKMKRGREKAIEKDADYFARQVEWKTENLLMNPEAFERLVFWPMPFEQADALAKKMRKSGNTLLKTRFYDFA
tara:strand:- start:62 stop:409 length:348 start_codon:yes stop_codon:yes gene_type:complete